MPLLPKGSSVYAGRKAGVEDSPQNIMHKPEISFILWKCYDNWYDTNIQSYLQVKSCFSCYITKQQMGTFEVSSRWQTTPRKSQQSTEELQVHGNLKQGITQFHFRLVDSHLSSNGVSKTVAQFFTPTEKQVVKYTRKTISNKLDAMEKEQKDTLR